MKRRLSTSRHETNDVIDVLDEHHFKWAAVTITHPQRRAQHPGGAAGIHDSGVVPYAHFFARMTDDDSQRVVLVVGEGQ